MLVATVEPSVLQGPPGSSLLWSVTLCGISWNLLVMVLGCPCNQEINFSKIRVTQNSVAQRIPGKCWINIT